MNRWVGRVAVVTGASSGIGEAISTELVKHGVIVVGLARGIEKLQKVADRLNANDVKKFHPLTCDITNEENIVTCFEQIQNLAGPTSILINSAGYLAPSSLLECIADDANKMFQTNVVGSILCGKAAIKSMMDNGIDDGHIVNINSIAGHTIMNWPEVFPFSVYTASKQAVTIITECLRKELRARRSKIKTTSLSPGIVRTDLTAAIQMSMFGPDAVPLEATDVADACITVLSTPPQVLITELTILPVGET